MADSPERKIRRVKNRTKSDCSVDNFLKWCTDVGLILSPKVTVREQGSCHRFGMIATQDLEIGEVLFTIPRNVLLEPNTSSISGIILEFAETLPENGTRNEWYTLLLTLLYEFTNPESKWRPYLDLVPSETVLNQPIFWNDQEREFLTLIGLKYGVDDDEKNIQHGYLEFIVPFMEKYKQYFDPKLHTLALYKRLAGFVMAYSFTDRDDESGKPAMVPMADILNHVSNNNAHLEYGDEFLSMVTTQFVAKGGEVFNTYGDLDDCNLLRSYGFIENSSNPYDEVEIPLKVFQDVLNIPDKNWQYKLSYIREETHDDVNIDEGIPFNVNGCLWSEQILYTFCQIMHDKTITESKPVLSQNNISHTENFEKQSNGDSDTSGDSLNDGDTSVDISGDGNTFRGISGTEGSDSESGGSDCRNILGYDELQRIPVDWKQTLHKSAKVCSENITKSLKELSEKINIETRRIAMVKHICHSHLTILRKIEKNL